MSLTFGTAPDSWGVWLPDHPSQPSWKQFLDETVESGYHILELGPYGYLPTEPEQLREELSIRNLSLIAGTMVADVMHLPGNTDALVAEVRKVCELAAPLGAKFFVLMVDGYRDDDGTLSGPSNLTGLDWATFVSNCNLIGKLIVEEFGMELTFHPHADSVIEYSSQVDKLLDDSDANFVQLCLDTGHYHYRGGDSAALLRERFARIPYLHLKSIDPNVMKRVEEENLSFSAAVKLGVACEPSIGTTDFAALEQSIKDVGWKGFAIVEQDMFPLASKDIPMPIAKRSREYYNSLGWAN